MGNKHGAPTPSQALDRPKTADVKEKSSAAEGRMGNKHSTHTPRAPKTGDLREKSSAAEGRKAYDYLYKVVLLGDMSTGTTSVLERIGCCGFCRRYIATIGIDFKLRSVSLDEIRYKLQVWDTAGSGSITLVRRYYREAHGIIIFYDALRRDTFYNVPNWIAEVRKYGHRDATLMLMGTKCDCSAEKVVAYETAKELADKNDMLFFEVSAKDDTNIELALLALVAEIRRKRV